MPDSVTAVINTFNRPDHLREAIWSVYKQTVPVSRIVVIDDGSDEDLHELVFSLSENERVPLEYKRHENAGLYPSRKRGLECVDSKWVAFLDDDDVWLDDHIERSLVLAKQNPDAVIIAGLIAREGKPKPTLPSDRMLEPFNSSHQSNVKTRAKAAIDSPFFAPPMSASLLSVKIAQQVNFDVDLRMRGDILIVWKMGEFGDIVLDMNIHAEAKQTSTSLASGVDRTNVVAYGEMRAETSRWQSEIIKRAIDERDRTEVPELYRELAAELLSQAIYLSDAGRKDSAVIAARASLGAKFSIRALKTLVELLLVSKIWKLPGRK